MRQIKFRGKRLDNGEWVYGDLEYSKRSNTARIHLYNNEGAYLWEEKVDPDTVGQFTGLYDTHGKEIYEGDILHTIGKNDLTKGKHYYRSVSFERGSFCMNVAEYNVTNPLHNHTIGGSLNWEVVGNIYDNPDLLNGK